MIVPAGLTPEPERSFPNPFTSQLSATNKMAICAPPVTMKLLIVEDNAEMRRLIIGIVGDLADEIAECTDGAEALAVYREFQPDLVLMDIRMARVDGITASRRLRADFPDAKICAVTDYTDEQTKEAARQAGISNYVAKESLYKIREIIERL
jgi:CheY-like chemotaxis protein